jgi:hypothetical protein
MNRWKVAFFGVLGLWLLTLVVGAYMTVDSAVTSTYAGEGDADCEAHRDWLDAMLRGQVTRAQVKAARPKVTRTVAEHSYVLELPQVWAWAGPKPQEASPPPEAAAKVEAKKERTPRGDGAGLLKPDGKRWTSSPALGGEAVGGCWHP